MLIPNIHTIKMGSTGKDFLVSQIKVTAFIQGVEISHCFNKSKMSLKSSYFFQK
jgi:hypothetical protein